MALSSAKFENVSEGGRREAGSVARQLEGSSRKRSATVKLEGLMLKLVRELAEIVMRNPGVIIAPFDRELSPAAASKILGISRPLVVRRMDDGRLPFRYEGKHRRCKLEDVRRLKAAEAKQMAASPAPGRARAALAATARSSRYGRAIGRSFCTASPRTTGRISVTLNYGHYVKSRRIGSIRARRSSR
jgi:excisionase family DNA binding protein